MGRSRDNADFMEAYTVVTPSYPPVALTCLKAVAKRDSQRSGKGSNQALWLLLRLACERHQVLFLTTTLLGW